jgi:DNA-binding Xre family transcriptional regulator
MDTKKKVKFICNLEDILTDRGLTKTDLTNGAGISPATTSKLTSGGRIEKIDRASTEKIIQFLECNFNDLWHITYD